MRAILPLHVTDIDELQVRLVDQSGWLERVAAAFMSHVASGNAAKLRMDDRHELLERSFIPLSPGDKEVRDLNGCRNRHRYPSPAVIVLSLTVQWPFSIGIPASSFTAGIRRPWQGGEHGPQYTDRRIGAVGGSCWRGNRQQPSRRSDRLCSVLLTDLAGVPADVLEHAKARRPRVFERSQIGLEWIDARRVRHVASS